MTGSWWVGRVSLIALSLVLQKIPTMLITSCFAGGRKRRTKTAHCRRTAAMERERQQHNLGIGFSVAGEENHRVEVVGGSGDDGTPGPLARASEWCSVVVPWLTLVAVVALSFILAFVLTSRGFLDADTEDEAGTPCGCRGIGGISDAWSGKGGKDGAGGGSGGSDDVAGDGATIVEWLALIFSIVVFRALVWRPVYIMAGVCLHRRLARRALRRAEEQQEQQVYEMSAYSGEDGDEDENGETGEECDGVGDIDGGGSGSDGQLAYSTTTTVSRRDVRPKSIDIDRESEEEEEEGTREGGGEGGEGEAKDEFAALSTMARSTSEPAPHVGARPKLRPGLSERKTKWLRSKKKKKRISWVPSPHVEGAGYGGGEGGGESLGTEVEMSERGGATTEQVGCSGGGGRGGEGGSGGNGSNGSKRGASQEGNSWHTTNPLHVRSSSCEAPSKG